ncbi:MAG: hypothetical protein HY547_04820 [Elusimicrobia bacterium]|nr:hypothetical protein [Elusimicrobiota bacterium]
MSSHESGDFFYAAAGMGAGVWLFWRGFRQLKFKKLVSGIATSKVRSLAMGTVELSGTTALIQNIVEPLYGQPCVFYSIVIKEKRGSGKSSEWVVIHREDSARQPFFLVDDTGRVPVLASGAEFYCSHDLDAGTGLFSSLDPSVRGYLERVSGDKIGGFFSKDLKVTATIIREGEPIYVLGYAAPADRPVTFMERAAGKAALSLREVSLKLKSDSERMKTVDANQDGTIDDAEWQEAVLRLKEELERQNPTSGHEVLSSTIIRKSPDGLLIIADKREDALVSELGANAWLQIIGGPAWVIASSAYLAWKLGLIGI